MGAQGTGGLYLSVYCRTTSYPRQVTVVTWDRSDLASYRCRELIGRGFHQVTKVTLPGNFPIRHDSHFVTGVILAAEVTRCEARNDRNQEISSRLAARLTKKDMMVRHEMGIEDVQGERTRITKTHLFRHWRMQLVVAAVMAAGIAATWLAVRLEDPSRASKPFRI